MSPDDLRRWADDPGQAASGLAAAVRELLRELEQLRARYLEVRGKVRESEALRRERDDARAANHHYEVELARLRKQLSALHPAPWERS